jgi:methylmalonyl-CoA/ethylmalonyl-CoA epimerase
VFTGGNHVCVVTGDLDRAVRTWADRYGVGPWRVFAYDADTMTAEVDGEQTHFAMRAALCNLGPSFRLEIIQPHDDRSPYARSLAEHDGRDHLHHVRLDVADFAGASEKLAGLGLPKLLEATFKGGDDRSRAHCRYFDTTGELGFLVEVAGLPEGFVMAEPQYVYPPDAS